MNSYTVDYVMYIIFNKTNEKKERSLILRKLKKKIIFTRYISSKCAKNILHIQYTVLIGKMAIHMVFELVLWVALAEEQKTDRTRGTIMNGIVFLDIIYVGIGREYVVANVAALDVQAV